MRKDLWGSILFWLGVISLIFGIGLWQAYTHATKFMENLLIGRISHEFAQPRIHTTVQDVAVTEAKRLLQEQVTPEVDRFKKAVSDKMDAFSENELKPLSKQVDSIRTAISEAEQTMRRLQEEQRLIAAVSRAEAFDKMALREIENLARGTNEIALLGQAMLNKVQRILILDRVDTAFLIPLEKKEDKAYGGPFTDDEIAVRLLSASPECAINIVGNEKRLLFVRKLVEIAHNSKDLWTINRVAKALSNIADVDFYPWDLNPLDVWWSKKSTTYTNQPFAEYLDAEGAFSACKYEDALQKFESVLAVDSAADRSRAMAVACAIEIGDTPRAKKLNAGYSQKDGRWEQWARCKVLLATGTVDQATREFASLAQRFPTFSDRAWIQQGNHVLR